MTVLIKGNLDSNFSSINESRTSQKRFLIFFSMLIIDDIWTKQLGHNLTDAITLNSLKLSKIRHWAVVVLKSTWLRQY